MKREYRVTVDGVTVYRGEDKYEARETFEVYRDRSANGEGRAGGESVTLWTDGEVQDEFVGSADSDD